MTEQTKQIGELELKMMKLIGELPKVINVPIGYKAFRHGVSFNDIKERLIGQYTLEDMELALDRLRSLGYIGEIGSLLSTKWGNGVYCIALTGEAIKRYKIHYC